MPRSPSAEIDRDRTRRSDRDRFDRELSPKMNNGRDRSPIRGPRKTGLDRRILVSNIPYDFRWQDLKDLFRSEVGEVSYVELFVDEHDKPKGSGVVEFESAELATKAIEKMHRYEIKGRKIVVKEDTGKGDREKQDRSGNYGSRSMSGSSMNRYDGNKMMPSAPSGPKGNMYGLSPAFLESLGINGPLITKVFVANLDYKVDEKKLKEVFKLAGRVLNIDLVLDKDGKSRGYGTVEYEHPVEAVQAISMLHNQMLYDRRINVRMDKSSVETGPPRLPEGLRAIGMGLGENGLPLQDVPRNLPNANLSSIEPAPQPMAPPPPQNPFSSLGSAAAAFNSLTPAAGFARELESRIIDSALLKRLELVSSTLLGSSNRDLQSVTNSLGGGVVGRALGDIPLDNSAGGLSHRRNIDPDYDPLSASLKSGNGNTQDYGRNFPDYDYRKSVAGLGSVERMDLGDMGGARNMDRGMDVKMERGLSDMPRHDAAVIVSNLPSNVTWQMLRDKFRAVGDVKFAEMKARDAGIVRFGSEREATRAILEFNNSRMDGHRIEVRPY